MSVKIIPTKLPFKVKIGESFVITGDRGQGTITVTLLSKFKGIKNCPGCSEAYIKMPNGTLGMALSYGDTPDEECPATYTGGWQDGMKKSQYLNLCKKFDCTPDWRE